MKQLISKGLVITASALTLLLAGCGSDGGDDNSQGATTVATAPPASTPPSTNPPATNPPASTNVAALSQSEAEAAAQKFLDERAAAFSTAVPATADERYKAHDTCYKHDGYTKDFLKQEFAVPTSLRSRDSQSYAVGFTRSNLNVSAIRFITNAIDNTTRNEIDVAYDQTNPAEGTTQRISQTLVNGSTTGVCAAGQDSADVRFLGNQRDFDVGFVAINQFQFDFLLASGALATPPSILRRAVRFDVRDPQGKAAYAVVSRQVPAGLWSIKLISPRLLANDATLSGKVGNYISGYATDEFFRVCQASGGSLVGASADCTLGTVVADLGTSINTSFDAPDAALVTGGDNTFAGFAFAAGETYKFEIFNDDGWKTVNGHVGKTPIATYNSEKLERLPYTFAELLTGPGRLTRTAPTNSLTNAQIAAAFTGSVDTMLTTTNGGLTALPDGRKFGRQTHYVFSQGPDAATVAPAFYPARRSIDYYFKVGPADQTLTTQPYTIPGKPANVRERTNGQTAQAYTDRGISQLRFIGNYRN